MLNACLDDISHFLFAKNKSYLMELYNLREQHINIFLIKNVIMSCHWVSLHALFSFSLGAVFFFLIIFVNFLLTLPHVLFLLQEDGILVIPTVADPPLKVNSKKGLLTEFHDRAFALSSIASMSGCCQVS